MPTPLGVAQTLPVPAPVRAPALALVPALVPALVALVRLFAAQVPSPASLLLALLPGLPSAA
jgi:hypothetical protein